jgi:hypothetical protein
MFTENPNPSSTHSSKEKLCNISKKPRLTYEITVCRLEALLWIFSYFASGLVVGAIITTALLRIKGGIKLSSSI